MREIEIKGSREDMNAVAKTKKIKCVIGREVDRQREREMGRKAKIKKRGKVGV